MKMKGFFNSKGVTLIELLVALFICAMIIGGIYRIFVAQSKAYTVQDQVLDVQQNIRNDMEILLRDLRMTGYDDDNVNSTVSFPYLEGASNGPGIVTLGSDNITIEYEFFDPTLGQYQRHRIAYWLDANTATLRRQRTIDAVAENPEVLLENVGVFNLTYGVDVNPRDEVMDDRNGNNLIDDGDWVTAANVGTMKVIAVRIRLTARPNQVNTDLNAVSPRSLESIVTLRNIIDK
jgi:prepilin-type N-terminal cleavage/methylation domain-containing protein